MVSRTLEGNAESGAAAAGFKPAAGTSLTVRRVERVFMGCGIFNLEQAAGRRRQEPRRETDGMFLLL